jgi:heme/copper-type cytochrome/quinol oxidase subunit 1
VTLNELGSLGEFISGLAVVVTLIYLALQIRHNTRAVRSSMHQDMVESTLRIAESMSDNENVGRIVLKANEDYDNLTREEFIRFEAYAERVFSNFESVFYSYRNAMIEQDLWESWEASYLSDLSREAIRRYWHDERPQHLRDFMDFVDQYYRTHPAKDAAKGS